MKKIIHHAMLGLAMMAIGFQTQVAAQATLLAHFDFNGNLQDDLGNATASLIGPVDTTYIADTLHWTALQSGLGCGLQITLPDAIFTEEDYSILIEFSMSETYPSRKVIDFKERGSESGVYINAGLRLDPLTFTGNTQFLPEWNYAILITRSVADDSIHGYKLIGLDLQLEGFGKDLNGDFVAQLNGNNRVLDFFVDDTIIGPDVSDRGTIGLIRIWNGIADMEAITGIAPSLAEGLSLSPNPASQSANLILPEAADVQIVNLLGQEVYAQPLSAGQHNIDLQGFAKGIYILRCMTADGVGVLKLIKE